MTDILLRYPMQTFLVGCVVLACNVGWCLYLIAETVSAHKEWNRENSNP